MIVYQTAGAFEVGTVKRKVRDAHGRTMLELFNGEVITPRQVVGIPDKGAPLAEIYEAVNEINRGASEFASVGTIKRVFAIEAAELVS